DSKQPNLGIRAIIIVVVALISQRPFVVTFRNDKGRHYVAIFHRGTALMKPLVMLILLSLLCLAAPQSQPAPYGDLNAEAERLYTEASYARARELYLKARAIKLPPEEARWVEFRLALTLWRPEAGAQAATQPADNTRYEAAQQQLEAIVRERRRTEDHDRVWAEAQESLGDLWWTRRGIKDWGHAWPHYQQALDWWAGTKDLDLG